MYRKCAIVYTGKIAKGGPNVGQWLPEKQCPNRALPDGVYCSRHARTQARIEQNRTLNSDPEHKAKLHAGLLRWRERMQKLKTEGVVDEIHSGVFKKGNKAASKKNKMLAKAKRGEPVAVSAVPKKHIVTATKLLEAEQKSLAPVPDKPFEELEDHEKLTVLTGKSLNIINQIISMPIDPEQPTLFKEQMKLLSGTLSLRVKVDRNMLQARKQDKLAEIVERLKAAPKTIDG